MTPLSTTIADMVFPEKVRGEAYGGFVPANAYYSMNTTTASPASATVVPDPECAANCSFAVPRAMPWVWAKVSATATITQAIEYHIVNNRTNSTSTSTSYLTPSGTRTYQSPMADERGTRVAQITLKDPDSKVTAVVNVTYPSVFTQFYSGYRWWGVLPTTVADGQAVCSWAPWWISSTSRDTLITRATVTTVANTTSRISYVTTRTTASFVTYAAGQVVTYTSIDNFGDTPEADPDDPKGLWYMPVGAAYDQLLGVPANIVDDAAVTECTYDKGHENGFLTLNPAQALETEIYLTATSIIHSDSPGGGDDNASAGESTLEPPLEPSTSDISSFPVDATALSTILPGASIQPTLPSATPDPAAATIIGDTQNLVPETPTTASPADGPDGDGSSSPAVTLALDTGAGKGVLVAGGTTLTSAGQALTLDSASAMVLLPDGRTLRPGSTVTLGDVDAGTATVALLPDPSSPSDAPLRLVINGAATSSLAGVAGQSLEPTEAVSVTLSDATLAVTPLASDADSDGIVAADGRTVYAGHSVTVTVDGATVVVGVLTQAHGATVVVVNGKTVTVGADAGSGIATSTAAADADVLGDAVWQGIGGTTVSKTDESSPTSASAGVDDAAAERKGSAAGMRGEWWWWWTALACGVSVMLFSHVDI